MLNKKTALITITLAALLTLFSAYAGAQSRESDVGVSFSVSEPYDGPALSKEKASFNGIKTPDGEIVFSDADDVKTSGDASDVFITEIDSKKYFGSRLAGDRGYARFTYEPESPLDFSEYGALVIGAFLSDSLNDSGKAENMESGSNAALTDEPPSSSGEQSVAILKDYNIKITVSSGEKTRRYSFLAREGSPVLTFCDVGEFRGEDGENLIEKIELEIEYDASEKRELGFYAAPPILIKDGSFLSNESLGASSISVFSGDAAHEGSSLKIAPSDGSAVIKADLSGDATPECYNANTGEAKDGEAPIVYAEVKITADSGTVSAEFSPSGTPLSNSGGAASAGTLQAPAQTISSGTHSYFFRISQRELKSYKLTLKNSSGGSFKIESVKFHYVKTGAPSSSFPCSITRSAVEGDVIRIEGKLSKSASVEYMNRDIGLFTLPVAGGVEELVETIKSSSKFSFEVPLSSYPHAAAENYFYVCVIDKDGKGTPISEKRFISAFSPSEGNSAVFGLHGADAAGVFESNASRAVVDVNLDRLRGGDGYLSSGAVCSRGSGVYFLDASYLGELDRDMKFYESSNVGVYLRFISNKPMRSLSLAYDLGKGTGGSGKDAEVGMQFYLAVVSFLCERYPNVLSIVLTSGVNSNPVIGQAPGSVWEYALGTAFLARLTYGAASEKLDNFFVTIPLAENKTTGSFYIEPELLAAMISEAFSSIGPAPWAVMYSSQGASFETLDAIITSARANSTSIPSSSSIFWTPDGSMDFETVLETFSGICKKNMNTAGSRAAFLSVSSVFSKIDALGYGALKSIMAREKDSALDADAAPLEEFDKNKFIGKYDLWDFTNSYNSLGWSAAIGADSCATYFKYDQTTFLGGRDNPRVLRFKTDGAADSSYGMIICNLKTPLNFLTSPYVEFDFSVESDLPVELTFLFGSGDKRVEYRFPCLNGAGNYKAVCDLSDFSGLSGSVGRLAIMARSDSSATVDVSKITSLSYDASSDELEAKFKTAFEGAPVDNGSDGSRFIALIAVCAATAVVSLWAVFHCYREDEERDASRRSGSK